MAFLHENHKFISLSSHVFSSTGNISRGIDQTLSIVFKGSKRNDIRQYHRTRAPKPVKTITLQKRLLESIAEFFDLRMKSMKDQINNLSLAFTRFMKEPLFSSNPNSHGRLKEQIVLNLY
ncbi:hypothetical protein ACTFIR_003799 [Dictyostelium discoideum]